MASEKIQGILDTVGGLTVLELNELVKELQEQWGVTAAVAAPAGGGGGGSAEAAPAAVEQDEFTVVLKDAGAQKIRSSKRFAKSSKVWASKKPKTWSMALLPPSKRVSPKRTLRR
jgi:ribosomal protein L7/L12